MPSEFYGGVGVDLLYPSSLGMSGFSDPEWSSSHIAPLPATDYNPDPYPTPGSTRPGPIEVSALPHHMTNIPRPKSSPSTFGPNVEDLLFTENPFKFKQEDFRDYPSFSFPSPVPSGKSSPFFGQEYSASARTSPVRQAPVAIAPDPVGLRQLQSMKRMREEDDAEAAGQQRKRKRAASSTGPVELNEEETLLLKLKEEENLPWKDIATRFHSDLGKTYQVPALQMRFKRLRERMRAWTETDIQALEKAHDHWKKCQFDIIASKMLEFGASEQWPAKQCARKWEELYPSHLSPLASSPTYTQQHHASLSDNFSLPDQCSLPDRQSYQQSLPDSNHESQYHYEPSPYKPSQYQPSQPQQPPSFLPDSWTSGHPSPVDSLLSQCRPSPSLRGVSPSPVGFVGYSRPTSAVDFRRSPRPSATF